MCRVRPTSVTTERFSFQRVAVKAQPGLVVLLSLVIALWGCTPKVQTISADWQSTAPKCLAPAKPGGGFDLTCRLIGDGFKAAGLLSKPMPVQYKPGGIGAVAMAGILSSARTNADTLVAFSTGSLLNLAQGKFGRGASADSVRWLGAAGVDYGALVVRAQSPYHSLADLITTLKRDPTKVVFGAGGTVGSQDWIKSALVFRELGLAPGAMRYVAFEGGGEAMAALLGGHIDVMPGDMAETVGLQGSGAIRILAVLSQDRLPAPFAGVPTALEQGLAVDWPILRGFYLPPDIAPVQYSWWANQFTQLHASPEFARLQQARGLLPLRLAGAEFETYVLDQMAQFRELAAEFKLLPPG